MSQGKVKFFKNSSRNQSDQYTSYVPQYQILGIEPEKVPARNLQQGTAQVNPGPINPRDKRPQINNPYAGAGKNSLPNVGNNMDQTWSSIDGSVLDDLSNDYEDNYVDNNDYISDFALGIKPEKNEFTSESNSDDFLNILQSMQPQAYLLIVNGVAVCSGPLNEVQEQANLLIFGDHPLCDGNPVPVEDMMIIKKAAIKVGLHLE